MKLDTYTALFVSASTLTAVSLAVLFFSLIKKANRFFLLAAIGSLGLATTACLIYFRGRIPDFFSIIVANELGIISVIAFYESFRFLKGTRPIERFIGPLAIAIQPAFLWWYTYHEPDFSTRVLIVSITMCIMCFCTIKLLFTNITKNQVLLTFVTSFPFFFMIAHSVIRIVIFISGKEFPENSLNSSAFALSVAIYGIIAVWTTMSLVFMVSDKLQTQVAEMALTDPLTHAFNRRALHNAAEREIARSKRMGTPLSLIIVDLDHFKKVNDTHGHQAGDAILVHVTTLFKEGLRQEDVLARYGGEEFVALLPGADINTAVSIAERLRETCSASTLTFKNKQIPITSSFGVSGFKTESVDYETLIKQADKALYNAKIDGRNRVVAFNA